MTRILGPLRPHHEDDRYPIVSQEYVKGGFHNASSLEEMLSIPEERLVTGTLCIVDKHIYHYENGKWLPFQFEAASDKPKQFILLQPKRSSIWHLNHNLNKQYPFIICFNCNNEEIIGAPVYVDFNYSYVEFNTPLSGKAIVQ